MTKTSVPSGVIHEAEQGYQIFATGRGKIWRTPGGHDLCLPTRALALAVASDLPEPAATTRVGGWGGGRKPPGLMAQLAFTAIDRVGPERAAVLGGMAAIIPTDLVCCRVVEPPALACRQEALFQPLLAWVAGVYGANLQVWSGIMPPPQPPAAIAALINALTGLDQWQLTVAQFVASLTGSVVLAQACLARIRDPVEIFELCELESSHQQQEWGQDQEEERRRLRLQAELAGARVFLDCCQPA